MGRIGVEIEIETCVLTCDGFTILKNVIAECHEFMFSVGTIPIAKLRVTRVAVMGRKVVTDVAITFVDDERCTCTQFKILFLGRKGAKKHKISSKNMLKSMHYLVVSQKRHNFAAVFQELKYKIV